MRALTKATITASVSTGAAIQVILVVYRDPIIAAFTSDAAAITILHTVWPLLCWMQPINAAIFAFDGLYTATRSWRYIRNIMLVGVTAIFAPALAAAIWYPPCVSVACGLLAVWMAKASLNVWRLACACYRIYVQLWPTWRDVDATSRVKPTELL
jgi:Na+-driven multidrug efflux pump